MPLMGAVGLWLWVLSAVPAVFRGPGLFISCERRRKPGLAQVLVEWTCRHGDAEGRGCAGLGGEQDVDGARGLLSV